MTTDNPYRSPASSKVISDSTELVTLVDIADALHATSRWVQVFAGTLAAISLLMFVGGFSLLTLSYSALGHLSTTFFRTGFVLIVVASLTVFPILKLLAFVRHAKRLHCDKDDRFLADALMEQRFFWQYVGIFTVLLLIVSVALFIVQ